MSEQETAPTWVLELSDIEARDIRGAIDATLIRLRQVHGKYLGDEGFSRIARLEALCQQLPEDV